MFLHRLKTDIINQSKMRFEMERWIEEYESEEEIVKLLIDKGFKSNKNIRHITEDTLKRKFKTLNPGQAAHLREAVSVLKPSPMKSHTHNQ